MKHATVLHWTPTAYLSDYKTRRLDLEEHGAYMLLLWHMWNDSECQCEFPMDSLALASIWGVSPERAMLLCESLIATGVAVVKVIERSSGNVLQSKRLREQRKAFAEMCEQKSEAGKESGRVRRNRHATLEGPDEQERTDVEHVFSPVEQMMNRNELTRDARPVSRSLVSRRPEDQTQRTPDRKRSGRGVSQSDLEIVRAYFEDKTGRATTPAEKAFITQAVREYGADETKVQIGYAIEAHADSVSAYAMHGLKNGVTG